MKLSLLIVGIACLIVTVLSCKQRNKPFLDYSNLKYDTATIALFKWDTTNYIFPNNSDPVPLNQSEIYLIDSLFRVSVLEYNNKQRQLLPLLHEKFSNDPHTPEYVLIDIKKYKRQYFPYKDVNGQKIVFINCFCGNPSGWREGFFSKQDGGNCYFDLKLDLTEKKCVGLSVHGY